MTSRLMSEAFMPSVPIVTPSETAIVLNSIGVPPAARMPSFTHSASRRWLRLQGMVSIHEVATPMIGWARSSSVKPDGLEHRPRARPIGAVRERVAVALAGIGRAVVGEGLVGGHRVLGGRASLQGD